ncbi:hypothetical protein BJY01DRAFT_245184 [Aspergillus pseudoustus]|uniref:Uncharacterized protein n=1 Tax=Aspergillus pseudoustus TaxID=1810923 RepID=A0ABR4KH04_9EURO
MVDEAHEVEAEIRRADDGWVAKGNPERIFLKDRSEWAKTLIDRWCAETVKYWGPRSGDLAKQVMSAVGTLSEAETTINQSGRGIIKFITALVKNNLEEWEENNFTEDERHAAKETLRGSYEPIIMNDKSQFDGMTLDAYCVVIDDEVVRTLAGADPETLVATQNGWAGANKYWVKTVEPELFDSDGEDDEGWMKCSVYRLWTLWVELDGQRPLASCAGGSPTGVYTG